MMLYNDFANTHGLGHDSAEVHSLFQSPSNLHSTITVLDFP